MPNALHHRASLLKHRANADLRESGCEEAQREGDGDERARPGLQKRMRVELELRTYLSLRTLPEI